MLHKYDVPYAEQFRSALTRAWTFSPIEVVAPVDVSRYADESRYAYFTVDRHYSPMSKNIESNDVMRILG